MKLADEIREHVRNELISPARRSGRSQITIRAGDVHRAMGLQNRMPAVCGALDAAKFYDEAGVTLVTRSGPHQGANARWDLSL
jgi:5-methylcytosine-specific restriction protein B